MKKPSKYHIWSLLLPTSLISLDRILMVKVVDFSKMVQVPILLKPNGFSIIAPGED